MNKRIVYIAGWMIVLVLSSCSPRALREARETVVRADSMRAAGQMYEDSSCLAQAYKTLGAIPFPFREGLGVGSAYAHACYHYGRLLRAKEDPVSAIQVFIAATHSHTRDYHILGRVYSNMGDIAHLAGEYSLSYDMYEKSGEMYLKNGDTLLYYYDLNNMALELAEQGKKDETYGILNKIERYNNPIVLTLSIATKAIVCNRVQQYDSAIHHTSQLLAWGYNEPDVLLTRAQAYSYLHQHDSATYYAKLVLSNSNKLFHRCNALYILTNEDEGKDITSVRETAMDRADTQRLVEIRQGKLAQAVQILDQDLNLKPDLRWLYSTIATALLIGGFFYWRYLIRKRQMHTHVEQLIDKQAYAITKSIKQHIDTTNIVDTLHWKSYSAMKADADLYLGGIVSKLEAKNLNETEIRFCVLTMLDFPQKQIAETIHYSYPSGLKTLKKRISVKVGTLPPNLHDFLFQLAITS